MRFEIDIKRRRLNPHEKDAIAAVFISGSKKDYPSAFQSGKTFIIHQGQ